MNTILMVNDIAFETTNNEETIHLIQPGRVTTISIEEGEMIAKSALKRGKEVGKIIILDINKNYVPIKEGECRWFVRNGYQATTECEKEALENIDYVFCPFCGCKIVRVKI